MALISCPECNKEISDTCKKCQHCGYKLKNKKNKKYLIISFTLIAILIISIGIKIIIDIVEYKKIAKNIDSRIEEILNGTIQDSIKIIQLKNEYDKLDSIVKKFVLNKESFENFEIVINEENFLEYFDVKVNISDYNEKFDYVNIIGLTEYRCTANMNVVIQPKTTFVCNNINVSLNMGLIGWNGGYISNARLDSSGNYKETKELSYKTPFPFEPAFYENNLIISDAKGTISF